MLAIASLATGFVVAAVTPSHSLDGGALGDLPLQDTLTAVGQTVGDDSLDMGDGIVEHDG